MRLRFVSCVIAVGVVVMFAVFEGENLGPGVDLALAFGIAQALPFLVLASLSSFLSRYGGWLIVIGALLLLVYGDWLTHQDLYSDPIAASGFLLVAMGVLGLVLVAIGLDAVVRVII